MENFLGMVASVISIADVINAPDYMLTIAMKALLNLKIAKISV